MLFYIGRARNGYVATRFIFLSSTAESSAAGGYVIFPELSGKVRRELVKTMNGLGKNLVLLPTVDLFDAVCNHL